MLYVFGDIHGRLDLLDAALDAIATRADSTRLIFLGDYVDRGPESKGVVERVMALEQSGYADALIGNHEEMMIASVLSKSYNYASKMWVNNGGGKALKSYGAGDNAYNAKWDLIPKEHIAWMNGLPSILQKYNRIFVHAGLLPRVPLNQHDDEHFLWIRDKFLLGKPGDFPAHVVHGHSHTVPIFKPDPSMPELHPHRTNLDTGAFMTGVLTVGVFDPEGDAGPLGLLRAIGPATDKAKRYPFDPPGDVEPDGCFVTEEWFA